MARFAPLAVATLALVGAVVLGWWVVAVVLALIVAVGRLRPRRSASTASCATTRCSGTCASASRRCGPSCSSTSSSATPTGGRTTATRARRSTSARRASRTSRRSVPSATSPRPGYEWLLHSTAPRRAARATRRASAIGGPDCTQPYEMALLNVSAMSFGALSGAALRRAQPGRARRRLRARHRRGRPDRAPPRGRRRPDLGARQRLLRRPHPRRRLRRAASSATRPRTPTSSCVSLKLSQGAKPGIGGQLPGSKVTKEIAEARDVPQGEPCVSPAAHTAFRTPRELVRFIAHMRELAGGKPAGFKLCVGHRHEFLAICKAMVEEGTTPDFIIVDGAEGGTGAAPMEYADHVGTPLTEGLMTVHNALVGVGLRDRDQARRQRQGRDRLGHRQAARAGRRLHQRRAGDDDGRRLHPVAGVPSEHVPGRRRHAGPEAGTGARRAGQDPARPPLPGGRGEGGGAHHGFDGARRSGQARAAPPDAARGRAHDAQLRASSTSGSSRASCSAATRARAGPPTGAARARTRSHEHRRRAHRRRARPPGRDAPSGASSATR